MEDDEPLYEFWFWMGSSAARRREVSEDFEVKEREKAYICVWGRLGYRTINNILFFCSL